MEYRFFLRSSSLSLFFIIFSGYLGIVSFLGCGLRFAEFGFVFVIALFWFFFAFFVFSCQ